MWINRKVIKIANPSLDQNPRTYLWQDIVATATTLTVLDTTWFEDISTEADKYFVIIGNYWEERAEITTVTAKTNTTFTVSATKFSHSASDPVTFIPYDSIRFYWMETEAGTPNLLSTTNIDVTSNFTSYTYTWEDYSYFLSRYYRSIATAAESASSDIFSINTFTKYSVKNIIESWVAKALTRIDENQNSVLNINKCLIFANEALEYIKLKKRTWQFLHKISTTNSLWGALVTVSWTNYIVNKPIDISNIESVKVDWTLLDYASHKKIDTMYDSTASGKPYHWTIRGWEMYLYPTPDAAYNIILEYFKDPATISSLTDTVDKEFMIPVTLYIWAQAAYTRGNDKRGDKLMAEFENTMASLIEEHTGPWQTWDAEEVEYTSIYNQE